MARLESSAKMSRKSSTEVPTHSQDATKCNQPTNVIGHDNHTTSSDHTSAHVNDEKRKRIEGGRARRHNRLEVTSAGHKVMVSLSFLLL